MLEKHRNKVAEEETTNRERKEKTNSKVARQRVKKIHSKVIKDSFVKAYFRMIKKNIVVMKVLLKYNQQLK